jgi:hypothetical protein
MGGSMNRFEVMIEKAYYIHERYGVTATFALLYHKQPIHVDDLGVFIRLSDHIIPIDAQHDFIIFTFTSEANAHKASQNLLRKLDNYFGDSSACIALDTFDPSKTPHNVLSRLQQILSETRKNSFARIEHDSILDASL